MSCVRTIAITNQKGGVGKTTTTVNLGAALAGNGRNVCLIDFDPQAHLTIHFGIDPTTTRAGVYDILTSDTPLRRAAINVEPNLTIIPSVIDLAAAEVELARTVGREQILRDRINEENLPYDFIMIDCPPSLGLLTLNALSAAEEVLIPLQPHFLALQGLGQLLETVSLVRRRINPGLKVAGVIFCMFETGTRLSGEVVEDVRKFFTSARSSDAPWSDAHIFKTYIRRNIKLAECPSHGATIGNYDPLSHGAEDYAALAEEFLAAFADNAGSDSAEHAGMETLTQATTLADVVDNEYAAEPTEPPSVPSPDAIQ